MTPYRYCHNCKRTENLTPTNGGYYVCSRCVSQSSGRFDMGLTEHEKMVADPPFGRVK